MSLYTHSRANTISISVLFFFKILPPPSRKAVTSSPLYTYHIPRVSFWNGLDKIRRPIQLHQWSIRASWANVSGMCCCQLNNTWKLDQASDITRVFECAPLHQILRRSRSTTWTMSHVRIWRSQWYLTSEEFDRLLGNFIMTDRSSWSSEPCVSADGQWISDVLDHLMHTRFYFFRRIADQ